jgi:hypothetical protein
VTGQCMLTISIAPDTLLPRRTFSPDLEPKTFTNREYLTQDCPSAHSSVPDSNQSD